MSPVRLRKIAADFTQRWRRSLATLAGLALGLLALGTILTTLVILSTDLDANFRATRPANIEIVIDGAATGLAEKIRALPGVTAAEERPEFSARIETAPGSWMPIVVTAIEDFDHLSVNTFRPGSGAWPPPEGAVLIERDGAGFLDSKTGATLKLRLPGKGETTAPLAGTVFDPGQHPSRMEMTLYGYVIRDTLAGWSVRLDSTHLLAATAPADAEKVAARIEDLTAAEGIGIRKISAQPAAVYGHQFQIRGILTLLGALAVVAFTLCVVLVVNLIGAIMSAEQRSIGVMRAVGATARQVTGDYVLGMAGMGALAGALAIPPALFLGMKLAKAITGLLNFELLTHAPPAWLPVALALLAIGLPILSSVGRILAATSLPVHLILALRSTGSSPAPWLDRLPPTIRMAGASLLRRPRLVLFTAAVLAIGLTFFTIALDLRASMAGTSAAMVRNQPYDIGVAFRHPVAEAEIAAWLDRFPGTARREYWRTAQGLFRRDGKRFGDSLPVTNLPADSAFHPQILAGSWLDPAQKDGIVVTQKLLADRPNLHLGDRLTLRVGGTERMVRIVGVAKAFAAGQVYALADGVGAANLAVLSLGGKGFQESRRLAQALEASPPDGLEIAEVGTVGLARAVIDAHLAPLTGIVLVIALLALGVGGVGLASAIAVSVAERFREIAAMKAIGGRAGTIFGQFALEAGFIACLGWLTALAVSPLFSASVISQFGTNIIGFPFEPMRDFAGLAAGLAAALTVALLSALGPVRAAIKANIHTVLRGG